MIKKFTKKDHALLKKWWDLYKWPAIPLHFLPDGFIAYVDDKPVIAGFLYIPKKGSISWFEWIIGNPFVSKEKREAGFKILLKSILKLAKKNKKTHIMTGSNNKTFLKKLESSGFIKTDDGISHYLKGV